MNTIDFNQEGGFPLDTNVLNFMQSSYLLLQALGELAGDCAIIQGCEQVGSTVKDGVVYIKDKEQNGEGRILRFQGGSISANVIIRKDVVSLDFETGEKLTEYYPCARFGTGGTTYPWSKFTRLTNIIELQKSVTPVGAIIMWSGSVENIPKYWALCNGTNGTPDLRGRFVVGAGGAYSIGNKGGEETHRLTVNEIPSHNHDQYLWKEASGDWRGGGSNSSPNATSWHNSTVKYGSTGSTGDGYAHENRPPYYALAYIMYTGK